MKKYSLNRDSGVEWIGEIPNHWIHSKLGFYTTKIGSGSTPRGGSEVYVDSGTPFIRSQNVHFSGLDLSDVSYITSEIHQSMENTIVRKNDILLNITGGSIGRCCIVQEEQEMNVNQHVSILRTKDTVKPKFLNYFLSSNVGQLQVFYNVSGGNREGLTIEGISDFRITVPPLNEQKKIISYLDEKTSKIDRLIQSKQRKIELLKEKRTSLINEVVTKGLNPDVEKKNSGVEWIGEIPSHWDVVKVKYLTNRIVDGTHFTPTYTDTGIPFLRVTDIHTDEINLENCKYISEVEHKELTKRCNPEKGDLLLSKNGTIGVTKVVDWDWEFSIFVSLCLIKFRRYSPYLFSYFFQSSIVDLQLFESSKKSTVTNLHLEKIRELLVTKPPVKEQKEIVQFLDSETQTVEKTIYLEIKKIDLLKEYKQSLISEVVTGKVNVQEEVDEVLV